ncbi:MAG: site-specific integrase [Chloroflexota bacterium]|nr:site-specific integrase [Chloroflexota bacterium]
MALYKRLGSDGRTARWQVVIDIDDAGTGKRKRRVLGTYSTKKIAEAEERKAFIDREQGTLLEKDTTSVADLLDRWLADKAATVTSNTIADYRLVITKHIKPSPLGPMRIRKVTPAFLQGQYMAWKDAGLSPRMIRGCHMRLSQAFDHAVRMKLLLHNPAKDVTAPRLPRASFDHWNPDEAKVFLKAAQDDTYAPLWDILLREGMRRGEALGLRWRDINWEAGSAHIVQSVVVDKNKAGGVLIQPRTKTKAGARTVQLTGGTLAALRALKDRRTWADNPAQKPSPDRLIFSVRDGGPINPNNIVRNFNAIIKAKKLRRIKVHELRHTAATLMLLAGVPAKVVSERLGHASIAITLDTYSHVLPSMQVDAAAAMDRLLG